MRPLIGTTHRATPSYCELLHGAVAPQRSTLTNTTTNADPRPVRSSAGPRHHSGMRPPSRLRSSIANDRIRNVAFDKNRSQKLDCLKHVSQLLTEKLNPNPQFLIWSPPSFFVFCNREFTSCDLVRMFFQKNIFVFLTSHNFIHGFP